MKKYTEKYQITNPSGEPVGPPQVFEADTKDEMISMLRAAHQNAASKFYETKKAVKLGLLMEPDSERPIQEFVERPLTADERIRLTSELGNASTQDSAFTKLLEAKFGAPLSIVRENLQEVEQNKYIRFVAEEIRKFTLDFPDYVKSDSNRDTLRDYLMKKGWPVTRKNLGIAYTDLLEEGDILVTTQPVDEEIEVAPATVSSVENQPALPLETEITVPVTEVAPISAPTSVVRPAVSSTLGRGSSSVPAAPTVKAKGITKQEVNDMSATDYAKRCATDPEFVKQVEVLYATK